MLHDLKNGLIRSQIPHQRQSLAILGAHEKNSITKEKVLHHRITKTVLLKNCEIANAGLVQICVADLGGIAVA